MPARSGLPSIERSTIQEMVVVLDHRTLEPALPNMADAAMAAVIAVGMRHGQRLKDAADRLARFRSQQQVKVVGH